MIYWIARFFLCGVSKLLFPITVRGRENLPRRQGYVLASNHLSNLDPLIVGIALNTQALHYVAKDSLFKNKILGYLLRRVNTFPIKRGASDFRAMRETFRRLKKGVPILLFPEGTRKADGGEKKVHAGIGFIAVKGKVPIVPVCIKDSDKVLPPGGRALKRHAVHVKFGRPLVFEEDQSYSDIARRVMEEILSLA